MRTVIIDGDILIYKIPDTCINKITFQDDETDDALYRIAEVGSKKGIVEYLINKIAQIKTKTKSENAVICLSSMTNFRKTLNPDYKHNRKKPKPFVYEFVRAYLKEHFQTFERENLEADDLIGIIATYQGNLKNIPKGEKVIWSVDKDFKTIPATFFREQKDGTLKKFVISEKEADYNLLLQTLTGDSTDGYNGCPNVGKVGAEKILGKIKDFCIDNGWMSVLEAFKKRDLSEEDALLQLRCARILRSCDYNFKTKEITLWQHL